jgi:hypothetical protein
MPLPPGSEDIEYRGFRLEVRNFGADWRVFINAPGGILAFSDVPYTNNINEKFKVIEKAKVLVNRYIMSSSKRKPY